MRRAPQKIRKNTKLRLTKSKRIKEEIRKYRELGYKRWAKETKYGNRWPATEGIFSAAKRKFGENLVEILGLLYAAIVELIVEKFWKLEAGMVIILALDIYSTMHHRTKDF